MVWLVLIARLILGAVFLMSSVTKLAAPREFVANAQKYRILPHPLTTAYALALLPLELGAAILLFLGVYTTLASLAVMVMLLTFMAAVGMVMRRGEHLNCSCFGLLYRERVGWPTQLRDGVLLLMALLIFLADDGSLTLSGLLTDVDIPSYAVALAGSLAVFVLSVGVVIVSFAAGRARKRAAVLWLESASFNPMQESKEGIAGDPEVLGNKS